MAGAGPTSFLIVEELFAVGSPDFLPALRSYFDPAPFANFANKWLADPRPWARQQMLAYIDLPLNVANHNSLVKRLFKGAEARKDDELIAAWAVAFDRLVRRVVKKRRSWDGSVFVHVQTQKNVLKLDPGERYFNRRTQEWVVHRPPAWIGELLFSYHTRYYLRRRAWRYLRYLGHQRPAAYVPAVSTMIGAYTDADLAAGENLMDSWSLLHACFFESPAISFTTHRARLAGGASVATLAAAPALGELWQQPGAAGVLLSLVGSARSTFARVWAIDLLKRWHVESLRGLPAGQVLPLLSHADERIQLFGLQLLEQASGLAALPFIAWFGLLQIKSLSILEAVTALMRQHVVPADVTLFDAITLAKVEAAPVARLGLYYLQPRSFDAPAQRQALVHLSEARSAASGYDIATWALGVLGTSSHYDIDQVIRFFDALVPQVRSAARDWLASDVAAEAGHKLTSSPGWNDAALWTRLLESPFEDVRAFLVETLQRRQLLPGANVNDLVTLWTTVLLNIHRGGRRKLSALRQISEAIRNRPADAETLMPVLVAAIRSVRAPEARAGLSAVVAAVAARPELESLARQQLPELQLEEAIAV